VENGAIVMRELQSPDALPRGLQAGQSPGRYQLTRDPHNRYFAWANGPQAIKPRAFAPKEALWRVERDATGTLQFAAVLPKFPPQAIIGVRACDLAALALQDAHFLREGRHDAHYASRREQLLLVAVQCAVPAATCLCASTGDGPTPSAGYDIALAEWPAALRWRAVQKGRPCWMPERRQSRRSSSKGASRAWPRGGRPAAAREEPA
jgi:hypothetical protein